MIPSMTIASAFARSRSVRRSALPACAGAACGLSRAWSSRRWPCPGRRDAPRLPRAFERLAIALRLEMSVAGVARRLAISWDQVDAIMLRAVERGKQRRQPRIVRHLGIDEKAVKKRHRYFTIVFDLDSGEVLWVGRDRKRASLDAFWAAFPPSSSPASRESRWICGDPTLSQRCSTFPTPSQRLSSTAST